MTQRPDPSEPDPSEPALVEALRELAHSPVLLVACDYDGTLAPIVDDPAEARPLRESLVALRSLARCADTHVAVISGRALSSLASGFEDPDGLLLVGSHGSEFDPGFASSLDPKLRALRDEIGCELRGIAETGPGLMLEEKPAGFAFHYRRADEALGREARERVLSGPGAREGVQIHEGKCVVELLVVETDKGQALRKVRSAVGATAAVFLGDDRTDEDAFATLAGPDVGVKVGHGASLAGYRVEDPEAVVRMLALLSELREAWVHEDAAVPIERHALLSDRRTCALVSDVGRVTWMCVPRLDSSSLFGELVGGPYAGYFDVRPAEDEGPPEQAYRDGSLVLETRWSGLTVTDFLDCSDKRPRRRAGRTDLVRIVEGRGRVRIEFAPRLDFGRAPTRLLRHEYGLQVAGSLEPIVLRAPGVEWTIESDGPNETAHAELDLDGGRLVLDLRYGTGSLGDTRRSGPERRDATHDYWARWAAALELPELDRDLVRRSALTLRALGYAPTGAIAAAATTSLPEEIGGVRNWDYRFCWPRDAALAAASLVRLGSQGEAMAFLDWMLSVLDACSSPSSLQPLYALSGDTVGPEAEIRELHGYRMSRPVRVSNSAANQVQLDVFAPVVDLVHLLLETEAPISAEHWRLVEAMVEAVGRRWQEPDHGIWEERLPPRNHVHSKVMCWMTVDRALAAGRAYDERERPDWVRLRDAIAEDVLEHGWSAERNAFTATYEDDYLDAAALWVGLSGLLPPTDERFVATVEAVEAELLDGPTVFRYRIDDGLPGREGGFHLCAAWLVQSYLAVGRTEDARRLYRRIADQAGPTGLLSEQVDPEDGTALGNFPQAYSHLAVVECALALEAASRT